MMDEILGLFLYRICFVYMDDIIIFSKSEEEHLMHIRQIFYKLRKVNLKIELEKSHFLTKEVMFLGHQVTSRVVEPNPTKIQGTIDFPIPKTIH